jgi:hypothetical protein
MLHPIVDRSAEAGPGSRQCASILFVSLELSQATWLVTLLQPGSDKMSKHPTPGGDGGIVGTAQPNA